MVGKSRQGVLVVAGISIAAAAVIVLAATTPISPNEEQNLTFADNNEQSESFFGIQVCSGGGLPSASIVDAEGFVMPYEQTEIGQYVLEHGSTGYLTTEYDFCANGTGSLGPNPSYTMRNSTGLQERFDSFNSTNHGISKFNPDAALPDENIIRYGPLGGMLSPTYVPFTISIPKAEGTGITISAADLTKIDEHAVQVTYVIATEPTAEQASYVFSFYRICPGLILTIGNEPSNEPVVQKWADGPFYGCTG